MGYAVYERDGRWAGYGVPATCDHPDCGASIDRGLGYLCGAVTDDRGCGLFFCSDHLWLTDDGVQLCQRCDNNEPPFDPTPDSQEWITHMLIDETWQQWRDENPAEADALRATP
jgi:hypothetical protein